MNRVESRARVLRYLATIQYQVELLAKHGQQSSAYAENVILEVMSAVTGQQWFNLNATKNNFPGIDLISTDRTHAVQATIRVTKKKFDDTVSVLQKLDSKSSPEASRVKAVEVVGFTSVRNPQVNAWAQFQCAGNAVHMRGISVEKRLQLERLEEEALGRLDHALQGLASTTGMYQLHSDEEELRQTILPFLDRNAIRDRRPVEVDWTAMQNAMLSIRRLLTQGVGDTGVLMTRPYQTFRPEIAKILREIHDESSAISTLLRDELRTPGSLLESHGVLIDGHRLRIQECVSRLASLAGFPAPIW